MTVSFPEQPETLSAAMPIRFRCDRCRQLMGIAKRKAGTRVACTNCGKEVLVPATDQVDLPPPVLPPPPLPPAAGVVPPRKPEVPLLERSDFDEQVEKADGLPVSHPEPRPGGPQMSILGARQAPSLPAPGQVSEPVEYDVEPVDPTQLPVSGSFVLSRVQMTLLTLGVILGLMLAFAGGLYVGKYHL